MIKWQIKLTPLYRTAIHDLCYSVYRFEMKVFSFSSLICKRKVKKYENVRKYVCRLGPVQTPNFSGAEPRVIRIKADSNYLDRPAHFGVNLLKKNVIKI